MRKNPCTLCAWVIMNVPMFMLLIAGFLTGMLTPFFHDMTFITHGIFTLFVMTTLWTGIIAAGIQTDFNHIAVLKDQYQQTVKVKDREDVKDALFANLELRLSIPNHITKLLLGLGFFGTVVGVIIGFSNFPANAFTDVTAMQAFVGIMLKGFAVELNTLLAGLVGSLWLSSVTFLLQRDSDKLFVRIIE